MSTDFKKFLSYLLVGIKKFFEKRLTPFLIKYHDTLLLLIFIPSISFLFVLIIVQWMSKGPWQIFLILLFLSLFFILTYIFLSKEQKEKMNRHQSLVAILAILIPVLLFFGQQANDSSNKFVEKEISLKEENNRNYNYLKEIITDLPKYPNTMLWTDFSLISYQQD